MHEPNSEVRPGSRSKRPDGKGFITKGLSDPSTDKAATQRGARQAENVDPPSVDAPHARRYRSAPVRTVDLPSSFVEDAEGALTRKGTPRLDVLCAARAAFLQRKSDRAETDALRYHTGAFALRREGEHVKSIQGHAEDLYRRLYKRPIPEGNPTDDPDFRRFYDRTRKALKRSDLLKDEGAAVPAREKIDRDRHGKRWSLSDRLREAQSGAETTDPRPFVRCTSDVLDTGRTDVWTRTERHVARENELHREFSHALTASELPGPWRTAEGRRFERRHARGGGDGPHYCTVGGWRPEAAGRSDRSRQAVRVPWIVAEIDGRTGQGEKDRAVSDRLARRLLRRLDTFGLDLSNVVVSYSGNASIHVRIPDGAVGCPIYRNEREATESIGRFFDRLCGADEALREAIDDACHRPGQMIRAVGSTHEATGRQTVGTTGQRFRETPSCYLWHLSEPEFQYTEPERFPVPRRVDFVPGLAALLDPPTDFPKTDDSDGGEKTNVQQYISGGQGVGPGGAQSAVARVRGGVAEGERWGRDVDRPEAVGRNWAALFVSHRVLSAATSKMKGWGAVLRWNRCNEPSLPRAELRAVFDRAWQFQRGHV